jgi:hypothetical protein
MRADGVALSGRPRVLHDRRHAWLAMLLGAAASHAACGVASDSAAPTRSTGPSAPPQSVRHEFAMPGRRAIAASVAALGSHVVVAWSASDGGGADLFAATSRDGGRTFSRPARVNRQPRTVDSTDPPRLALASTDNGPKAYVVWTSSVGGGYAVRLATAGPARWAFDERPSALAAGALRPAPRIAARAGEAPVIVWRGGESRRAAGVGLASVQGADAAGRHPDGAWLYAAPWGEAGPDPPGPVVRDACEHAEAAVTAGPSGEIYVAWRRAAAGGGADVAVIRSAGHSSFDPPVLVGLVSDDAGSRADGRPTAAGCGDGGLTMSTDTSGLTHVVWQAAPGEAGRTSVLLLAWSRDGRAFTRPARVDPTEAHDPQHPQLAVVGGSDIVLVWDALQGDRRQVWLRVTAGTCGRAADPFGPPTVVSGEFPAVRPVVAAAYEGLVVAWIEHRPGGPVVVVRRLVWADIESWP